MKLTFKGKTAVVTGASGGMGLVTVEKLIQSKKKFLFNNLKKNSKWLTLNSILVQFYDVFDKYLI